MNHSNWEGTKSRSDFPADLKVGNIFVSSSREPQCVFPIGLHGVIDTGSDGLVIPHTVVDHLGLTPSGMFPVQDFDGNTQERDYYLVDLEIAGIATVRMEPAITTEDNFVLIGRSILSRAKLLLVVDAANRRWSWGTASEGQFAACEQVDVLKRRAAYRGVFRWEG